MGEKGHSGVSLPNAPKAMTVDNQTVEGQHHQEPPQMNLHYDTLPKVQFPVMCHKPEMTVLV
jgi:hypothetical protein